MIEVDDSLTRYEVYQQLTAQAEIACSPDAGHVVKREAWERIDFLLDTLIDLNFLETVVTSDES